jgi:zinc finger-like protein
MMDSLREATKNTMFDQWLDAVQGGNGSDTGTPRLAPPSASSAAAAAAGAGEAPGGQQQQPQQQQQQQVDAHMQLAEIAGYLADGDTANVAGAAFAGPGAAAAVPGLSAAGLHHQQQQHHQQQLTLQQQTEVSGTVAESTNYVPGWEDIFNINQKQLEGAIRRVSNDPNLEPQRKAYLIQNIMVSRYIVAQQRRMRTQGSLTAAGSAAIAAAAAAAAGGGDGAAAAAGGPSHSHGAGCCHHGHQQQQFGPVMHQHQLLQPPAPVAMHPRQALQPSSSSGVGGAPASSAAADGGGGGAAAAAAGGSVARQTYTDASSGILGCQHYRRATRLVAPCCDQVFTCRCGQTPQGGTGYRY